MRGQDLAVVFQSLYGITGSNKADVHPGNLVLLKICTFILTVFAAMSNEGILGGCALMLVFLPPYRISCLSNYLIALYRHCKENSKFRVC